MEQELAPIKKQKRLLQSIHFNPGHVMLDYGDFRKFQVCKNCKDGKHLKSLLNYFCAQVPLPWLTEALAIRLERRLYHILARSSVRWAAFREIVEYGDYVAVRCERERKAAEKRARRALREGQGNIEVANCDFDKGKK